jgi:hypothetical protein
VTIIRIEHSSDYTCISNKTMRDKRLSYKARGVHHLLLSYPNNWTVNIDHLAAASDKDGRAAVMSALTELQEYGYMTMRRVRSQQTGKFIGWEKVIRETPIPQDEAVSTVVRKSNVSEKARKTSLATDVRKSNVGDAEVRFSDVGDTEVRKTALRINRKTDKPQDGKSDHIISTDQNKYLVKEVSISPLTPQAEPERVEQVGQVKQVGQAKRVGQVEQVGQVKQVEQVRQVEQVEQLEISFSSPESTNCSPLEKQLESHLSEKVVDAAGAHTPCPSPQVEILLSQSSQSNAQGQPLPSPPQPLDNEQTPPLRHTISPDVLKSDRANSTNSTPVALAALTKQLKQAEDLRWGQKKIPGKDEQGQWLPEMVEAIYLSSPTHYSIQIGELKGQKNHHHCIKALDRLEREARSGKNEAIVSLKSFSDNANSLIAQRRRQQEVSHAHQMAREIPHFPMMPFSWHAQLLQAYKTLGEEAFISREGWHKDWLGYAERYLRQQLLANA